MAKDYSKKVQFYAKKGYSKDLLEFVSALDPGKHFNWFVESLKKFITFDKDLVYKCKVILNFFKKGPSDTLSSSISFEEALEGGLKFKEYEEGYSSKILFKFKDGHHIFLLSPEDLPSEGNIMVNCLDGYKTEVREGLCAILSLRDKNKKSIANFQVLPNGSLAQNFERGNKQVKYSTWKYINEFFNVHGKDLKKVKGLDGSKFTKLTLQGDAFSLPKVAQGIPTSIRTYVNEKGDISAAVESFNFTKMVEGTQFDDVLEYGSAQEIIKHLDEVKERFLQAIERLKLFTLDLEESNLFLNDDIKKKIFGEEFSLKGEISSIAELVNSFKISKSRRRRNNRFDELIRGTLEGVRNDNRGILEEVNPNQVNLLEEDVAGHPDEGIAAVINERIQERILNEIHEDEIHEREVEDPYPDEDYIEGEEN